MINEEQFKELVAKNLTNYRKINNLTQLDLAEKLSYSDKAISKWERGESLPDLYTLEKIANLYGITINDLVYEKQEIIKPKKLKKTNHLFVTLLSTILVWFIATLTFVTLMLIPATSSYDNWLAFIIAIPTFFIVLTVFACLWYKNVLRCISVSGIVWGVVIALQIILYLNHLKNNSLIYIIAGVFQILVILWFIMVDYQKKSKIK
ncbi:MAG: helix-turn-helix transcriptional regulator [Erysipelotrichaceae bacterium]|nr:helix-turn-helix transcriptional regulator [Erysipelotrichaceae bacterium]